MNNYKKRYFKKKIKVNYFKYMTEGDLTGKDSGFNELMSIPIVNVVIGLIVIILVPFYYLYWLFFVREIYWEETK